MLHPNMDLMFKERPHIHSLGCHQNFRHENLINSSKVKNEVAQVNALMDEYMPGLNAGSVDPETVVQELIEKLKAAGLEKIMEDADTQLAAWAGGQ